MRFGLVIYGSIDTPTGGYLYDRKLVEHLRKRGHQLDIVSIDKRGYLENVPDNFDPALRDRLASLDVDVLLQDELNHPSLFHLNRYLRSRGRYRIVAIVHHLSCSAALTPREEGTSRFLEGRFLETVDGCIYSSSATKADAKRILPWAPNGVVALPGKDHILVPDHLKERPTGLPLRIMYLGNIVPHKGLYVLVEALGRLNGEDFLLNVVGAPVDDAYYGRVLARISELGLSDRVRLRGYVEQELLPLCFQESDVLAVPSYCEGFGIVYVEAMGHGLPVIMSTAAGAKEIITSNEDGLLVPPGDPDALARSLSLLLNDRKMVRTMSEKARQRFVTLPTWEDSMERACQYLTSLP